jgi:RNA polymerase sigma-70 factor (ECF subfamily)
MSDRNILKKIKQGDTRAFEKLYKEYHLIVYNYIRSFVRDSFEAENILQDVFISVWETRHKINEYMVIGSLLYRIARNKALNALRKEVNKKTYLEYLSFISSNADSSTELKIDFEELEFFIRKFIMKLPDRRREIFLYSFDKGLSYKEIALKLSISENTVDTQIRNALEYLRENILLHFNLK